MDADERAAKREEHVQAVMDRTGKTREQAEAFFALVAHSMGWRPRMSDDEFRAAFETFIDQQGRP